MGLFNSLKGAAKSLGSRIKSAGKSFSGKVKSAERSLRDWVTEEVPMTDLEISAEQMNKNYSFQQKILKANSGPTNAEVAGDIYREATAEMSNFNAGKSSIQEAERLKPRVEITPQQESLIRQDKIKRASEQEIKKAPQKTDIEELADEYQETATKNDLVRQDKVKQEYEQKIEETPQKTDLEELEEAYSGPEPLSEDFGISEIKTGRRGKRSRSTVADHVLEQDQKRGFKTKDGKFYTKQQIENELKQNKIDVNNNEQLQGYFASRYGATAEETAQQAEATQAAASGKTKLKSNRSPGTPDGSTDSQFAKHAGIAFAGLTAGVGITYALTRNRGQQSNAQLYGQQPLY